MINEEQTPNFESEQVGSTPDYLQDLSGEAEKRIQEALKDQELIPIAGNYRITDEIYLKAIKEADKELKDDKGYLIDDTHERIYDKWVVGRYVGMPYLVDKLVITGIGETATVTSIDIMPVYKNVVRRLIRPSIIIKQSIDSYRSMRDYDDILFGIKKLIKQLGIDPNDLVQQTFKLKK